MGLSLGDELSQTITDFEQKYGTTMVAFDSYTAHIEMSKKKIQIVDEFLEKTKKIIKWDILDRNDIRNQIKQCPHCSQFLVKTEGCDGKTTCGNVPTKYDVDEKKGSPWYKYMVKRVNGKIKIDKKTSKGFLTDKKPSDEKKVFIKNQLKPSAQLGLSGCGREFEWGVIPFLSGETFEHIMKELNSTTEQAVESVAKATQQEVKPKSNLEEMGVTDESFVNSREAYEKTIDTTIKSSNMPG